MIIWSKPETMTSIIYGATEIAHLSRRDKRLGAAIARLGMIERPTTPDLFTALIKNIVEQQISVKAAVTVYARLLALCGEMTPQQIVALNVETIQQCGMTMRKAGYILNAADAVLNGRLNLNALIQSSDDEVIRALSALDGVGVWTAEMLLISALARPDVVSWGDLAIRRGMMVLYGQQTLTKEQFARYRKRYAPYGTTASLYLWALSKEAASG